MPKPPEKLEALAGELKKLSEVLADEKPSEALSPNRVLRVRRTIAQASENLRKVMEELDPIKRPGFVFDPSNPNIVGRLIGITMVAQDRKPLAAIERFYGSGVYALYYKGGFPAYAQVSGKEHPVYVGKADPADPGAKTAIEQEDRLYGRLNDHRKSIEKAEGTLLVEDFEYRALVVQSGWQIAAEGYLIHLFKPIWNNEAGICYGIGKHGDSPETRANLRSPWDTLHPGRSWAHRDRNMRDAHPEAEIIQAIARHLAANPPFESVDQILLRFLDDIRSMS
jgi:hypothetical protein